MPTEYFTRSMIGEFSSSGTEGGQHFYPCNEMIDPFTTEGGGTLVKTICWPKVDLFFAAQVPHVPPEFAWALAGMTWIAWYSFDGSIPPWNIISPYNENCVLRSGLTPASSPSYVVEGGYHVTFTCGAEGITSRRMHKPQDPLLTAKLITGWWCDDGYLIPGEYPDGFFIHGSSTDYSLWEHHT